MRFIAAFILALFLSGCATSRTAAAIRTRLAVDAEHDIAATAATAAMLSLLDRDEEADDAPSPPSSRWAGRMARASRRDVPAVRHRSCCRTCSGK